MLYVIWVLVSPLFPKLCAICLISMILMIAILHVLLFLVDLSLTIGAIIDMKEGNIRFQFPLKKGMEHFPRKKVKLPYESIMRATYEFSAKDGNT